MYQFQQDKFCVLRECIRLTPEVGNRILWKVEVPLPVMKTVHAYVEWTAYC